MSVELHRCRRGGIGFPLLPVAAAGRCRLAHADDEVIEVGLVEYDRLAVDGVLLLLVQELHNLRRHEGMNK